MREFRWVKVEVGRGICVACRRFLCDLPMWKYTDDYTTKACCCLECADALVEGDQS